MTKEKYDPPYPRRMYTIMSTEEAANGKKSYWAELEISGEDRLRRHYMLQHQIQMKLFGLAHVKKLIVVTALVCISHFTPNYMYK
jgi:spermidine synthase